ncbi:MAG TPA: hypothetical protein VM537_27835 [Anaerolineae bacterium]|nr:hypothetical protein [Anaerolineae bacterium]
MIRKDNADELADIAHEIGAEVIRAAVQAASGDGTKEDSGS